MALPGVHKLTFQSGLIEDAPSIAIEPDVIPLPSSALDRLTRTCVLIHAGPNGEPATLYASTGEITFDDDRIEDVVQMQNAKLDEDLLSHYESWADIPIGAFPPVLDAHDDQSSVQKVIGRMTGRLRFERRDLPKVGKNCACACAEITFLGRETVDRVADGRIYHLSIGISEDTNTLTELSAVIEPAAPGAMILKRGAFVPSKKNLERIARLKALKTDLQTLEKTMTATKDKASLEAKKNGVVQKLTAVMKGGKLTRAEIKGMDVAKLASLPKPALDILFETLEALEPKVRPGQMGSTQSIEIAKLAKQAGEAQLKTEIRTDLTKLGAKLRPTAKIDHTAKLSKLADGPAMPAKKMQDDDDTDAQSTVPVVDQGEGGLPAMQKQIDELNTQIARVAGIVTDLLEESPEDGSDDEGEMAEAKDPKKDQDDKDDKKLEDGKDDDEEKKLDEGDEDKAKDEKKLSDEPKKNPFDDDDKKDSKKKK